MISPSLESNLISSLPPDFESLSSFEFGKLTIELNIEQLQQLNVRRYQFQFLGGKSQVFDCASSRKVYQFPIRTTLWHFYQYLKDMDTIKIKLQSQNFSKNLTCSKKLELISPTKVLSKTYVKGNYIANSVELCDIFSEDNQNKGYVMFKVKLEFDEETHREIQELVDFQSLLNNPEEINRQKQQFTQVFNKPLKNIPANSMKANNLNCPLHEQNQSNYQRSSMPFKLSDVKHLDQQDSRMVQDDIDRMIAQIQNKPYDSSRYLDNSAPNDLGIAPSSTFTNQAPFSQNLIKTQPFFPPSNIYQNNFPLSQSIANDSRMNRFQQQGFNQARNDLNRSQQKSKSPHMGRKYPPMPLPNNQGLNNTSNLMANTTIYAQSQRSVSPGPGRNRSLNKSQQISYQNQRNIRNVHSNNGMSMSGSFLSNQANKGTLKIQIHELLGRQLDIDHCMLRVSVNNEYDDVINCKGVQQGQVIVYNQKAQLNQCQLCDIEKLRFQLENYEGRCLYSAEFQMCRLLNIPKLEGIFMLNLHPHQQQFYGSQVTASQTVLRKLQKPPSQKSLRITVAFIQEIQVIQMYLNLSKFSLNFSKCKYKIPFTKETVQFQPTQTHFNIFPHSKAYPKLMIQFWDQNKIIGVSQINLSNLKNITKNVLECNLEPIYLFDCIYPIKNIMTQSQVGKFKLLVCCGNVRQVQHVLNKSMLSRTALMTEMSCSSMGRTGVEVDYDKKLGVFIKDRRQSQEIQIQVDCRELQRSGVNMSHKQSQLLRKEDSEQVQMLSQNEFLSINKEKQISRVHSTHLNQQQDVQDEQEEQKVQANFPAIKDPQLMFKKQSQKVVEQSKVFPQQIKEKQASLPKVLKNLQSIICQKIQEQLQVLSQSNFLTFKQLKRLCKPHLLFNFIDIDILIKKMMEIGVSKSSISNILEILQPLNGMVNFNLLNGLMISLQLEDEIKYNLVPGKLFVRMALEEYYRRCCQQVQRVETEFSDDYNFDQKEWLSQKYLMQIPTLDESIDFSEMRKLFSAVGMKIAMSEYTSLKSFLQNQKEIRDFLFQLAQSKTAYQSIIKRQKNLYEVLKLTVIEEILKRKKEQQITHNYQQNIIDNLYNSHSYNQQLNSSRVSSTHNPLQQSRASSIYQPKQNFIETKKTYPHQNAQQQLQTKQYQPQIIERSLPPINKTYQNQDDFIISSLNNKTLQKHKENLENQRKQIKNQSQSDKDSNTEIVNVKKFKQKAPQVSLSTKGQTIIKYTSKRKIEVEGLQNCKSTYQCQLDKQLSSPYIKVVIQSPYQRKIYFKESDDSNKQQFEVDHMEEGEDEQIEGQVKLMEMGQKGQRVVAVARFVVIRGIKAVYAVKTLEEEAFCGLVNITIE